METIKIIIYFFSLIRNYFCPIINYYSHENIGIGFCTQHFPLEEESLGSRNNSIGICRKDGIWIGGSWIEFANGHELWCFNEWDFIGLGIIHHPNSKLECFATFDGKLLGNKIFK